HTVSNRPHDNLVVFREAALFGLCFQRADDLTANGNGNGHGSFRGWRGIGTLYFQKVVAINAALCLRFHVFPRGAGQPAVERVDLLDTFFRLQDQTRVLNGKCDLVGKKLECAQFFGAEAVGDNALNVQRADDLIADLQGQRHLRASLRQQRVDAVWPLWFGGIVDNQGLSGCRHRADHRFRPNRNFEVLLKQFLPGFTVAVNQHGVLAHVVQQKHLRVVKTELFADQVDGAVEQFVDVAQGRGFVPDAGGNIEVAGVTPDLRL